MSPICVAGHHSTTSDYCDVCGLELEEPAPTVPPDGPADGPTDGPAETAGPPPSSTVPIETTPASPSTRACPHCAAPTDVDGDFCESCGGDLREGAAPARRSPAEPAPPASAGWEALIIVDPDHFARFDAGDVHLPEATPDRRVPLGETEVRIGRRSASRGIEPEIDLAGPPEDSAVSHDQARLRPLEDGRWCVVDSGSSNGTFVNEGPDPLAPGQEVEVGDGDRIHVGAWTTIVLRHGRLTTSPSSD